MVQEPDNIHKWEYEVKSKTVKNRWGRDETTTYHMFKSGPVVLTIHLYAIRPRRWSANVSGVAGKFKFFPTSNVLDAFSYASELRSEL